MSELIETGERAVQFIGAVAGSWLFVYVVVESIRLFISEKAADAVPEVLDLERYRAWRDYFAEKRQDPATEVKQ